MRCPQFPFSLLPRGAGCRGADAWLRQLLEEGELNRWTTGDGRPTGARIYIWQAARPGGLPPKLAELLASHGVSPVIVFPDTGQE
jgi:hypothetical protein